MARNLDAELRGRPLEAFTFQGVRRLGRDPPRGRRHRRALGVGRDGLIAVGGQEPGRV